MRKVCESGYTKKRNKMLSNTMLWDVTSIKTYVIASLYASKGRKTMFTVRPQRLRDLNLLNL